MALRDCINRAVAGGEMDRERADRILREYDNAFRDFQSRMGYTQAEIEAARHVQRAGRAEAARKRRLVQLQAAAMKTQVGRMQRHKDVIGRLSPGDFLQNLIEQRRGAEGATLDGQQQAIYRRAMAPLREMTKTFRQLPGGFQAQREKLNNVRRELFGESTRDEFAKRMARQWEQTAENLRLRFNAAGGAIPKLEGWALPQAHDHRKVANVGEKDWVDYMLGADRGGQPRIDLDAMGERFNNGLPFTRETIIPHLQRAYNTIRTEGREQRNISGQGAGRSLANRRMDSRFFLFRSADDWAEYSRRFGTGDDEFQIMVAHVNDMATEIAQMEILGPNPQNGFRYLADAAMHLADRQGDQAVQDRTRKQIRTAENMFNISTGRANVPDNPRLARFMAGVRSYNVSAMLGSAVISAINDFNTRRVQAGFMGMSRSKTFRMAARVMTDRRYQDAAHDAGILFENGTMIGHAAARMHAEDIVVRGAQRLADGTIRLSGLGWLTERNRQTFGLAVMNEAVDWAKQSWSEMPAKTRRAFQAYGIGERDWGFIQRARIHEDPSGLRLLRAQEVEEAAGRGVADRYMEMISSVTEMAVPTSSTFGRAIILGNTKPGSLIGEIARSGFQFKSFGVAVMTQHLGQLTAEIMAGRRTNALSYAAGFLIGSTIYGAAALQLKEMTKGRDPRKMDSPEFWGAAVLQGGGFGIFGDFFFADQNRFGGGLWQTAAGPSVNLAEDLSRLTIGNAQAAARGDDMNMGRDLVDMLRRYTPGGSLWYLRLAYEREVLDQLQQVADPEAARSFRRRVQSAREYDTQFFAPPGSSVIQGRGSVRAPDFSNAFGG